MTVRLMRLLAIWAQLAPMCLSDDAAQAPPIRRAGMHQENLEGEPYQRQRDLRMSSKENLFSHDKSKGMGKSSSKSGKSGKGKGWSYDRHYRQSPTRPPILDLVDLYRLRRTTPVPTWTPLDEELLVVPQPTPPATLAPVFGTGAPQQLPMTTVSPTVSPTIPKTAPPTRDLSLPPTWDDTPQPTVARTLQRTNNLFTRAEARQAELDCELTAGGLFGMPSDTSSVYQVEFLYQIYVTAGTTEAVLRSQVAPLLDEAVTTLILPAFFDCGNSSRRRRRFLQSTGTIDGISSRPEDEIFLLGLPCSGTPKEGSDCYVVKGYVSVFASGFRTPQDLKDFVLPEIRKILQGSALSTLIPEVTGAQNLNDDLSPMDPSAPTPPSPTPSVDPTAPTTAESLAGGETPTTQLANTTVPPADRPSPLVPTSPTTPEAPTNVETQSVEDDESFLDKLEWWGWILIVGGGLIVLSATLTFIMNRKQPSRRPPGQPMRSDEDKDTQDNSAAYKPPSDDNYNGFKKSAKVDSNGGRYQVAPTTSDRDIGQFQTTLAANGDAGRYQAASAAAALAIAAAAAAGDARNQRGPAESTNSTRYQPHSPPRYQPPAAAAAAAAARNQRGPAESTNSTRYQPHSPPRHQPPPPAATDVGRFQEAPASQGLGQLGSVDEAASYHHSVAYTPENQPPPTQHHYQQQQQQQQQNPHEEEVSEYEEYIEEEYIEEGTGTGSGEYDDVEEEYVEEIHEEEADESYESYEEEEEEVIIEGHS